jgi:hypothetical protein
MAIKHVEFDDFGFLLGTSLTGSYQTLLSLSDDADVLAIFNTCDNPITLQVPSKLSTKEIRLPARASTVFDFRTNSKRMAKGIIKVKHSGVAPTTGEISVTVFR